MIKIVVAALVSIFLFLLIIFAMFDTYIVGDEAKVSLILFNDQNIEAQSLCENKNMDFVAFDLITKEAVCYTKSPAKHYRYSI